ncbi:4-hydroxybenzoate 3-monooxygenase [Streptomyces radicis]|uniref:4-hydroxybenzoate 3-monooxygenase n=1 Tax=Streptomyces radicis TaxID=1750517 RepID=A0A3A9WCV9_9ACTN|nr:4-hydroxybenzoate 3-monooxygenase [Streptomyces radicis]RKN07194.1 4-hydroxybenzoate 3-monooxygenase [Streptomyces radicis]RKN26787.1 4-hydroxybenzoate 3-monooxygenase [Streptomyces radicis]
MRRLRTQVAIIGAGPAGLVLANVLTRAGVDCRVVERRSRAHVEARARAGLLEHRTVATLRRHGLAGRLLSDGVRHGWCDFRCLDRSVRVDYGTLSGGHAHWVYPQQFLVRDLIEALGRGGVRPLFSQTVRAVADIDTTRPRVRCDTLEIACDYVVGCDGFRGVSRAALPRAHRVVPHRYPYDWLTVLAEVDEAAPGVVYAVGAEGFAGMMPRTRHLSRFYLQCAAGDTEAHWPARRIREQLHARLTPLPRIESLPEVRVLRMRSSVTEPLRHGRLLLAGDAAHVLTPSGAKGMNLAIADAAGAAEALVRGLREGDAGALAAYSGRRLAEIWRVQEFSDRLLRLLHLPPGEDPRFALRMRLAAIERLAEPGPHAAAFAHQYVGSGAEGSGDGRPD